MSNKIVLDTHVLLWILLEPSEIRENLKKQISLAQKNNQLIISAISMWEIAMLAHKKRINIFEPLADFLNSIKNLRGVMVENISPEIAAASVNFEDDFHGDPADRMIVATAKINGATLFTRDKKILDWAKLGNIKFMKV